MSPVPPHAEISWERCSAATWLPQWRCSPRKSVHLWGHWGFCGGKRAGSACRVRFLRVGSKTHPSGRRLRVCPVPWEPTAQGQVSYLLEKQKPPPRAWKWVFSDNSCVILGWGQRPTSPSFPFSTVDEYSPQRKVSKAAPLAWDGVIRLRGWGPRLQLAYTLLHQPPWASAGSGSALCPGLVLRFLFFVSGGAFWSFWVFPVSPEWCKSECQTRKKKKKIPGKNLDSKCKKVLEEKVSHLQPRKGGSSQNECVSYSTWGRECKVSFRHKLYRSW